METDSNIKLVPIKKCICKKVYEMYQDIPKKEIGSINNIFGVDYNELLKIYNKRLTINHIIIKPNLTGWMQCNILLRFLPTHTRFTYMKQFQFFIHNRRYSINIFTFMEPQIA